MMHRQYLTYVSVGVGVTLATIMVREVVDWLMPGVSLQHYQRTVVIAYVIGIILSIFAHKTITFRWTERLSLLQVVTFVAVHLAGMTANLVGSTVLLQQLTAFQISQALAGTLAFGVTAFLVSLVTFVLKRTYVFAQTS
jgi:putative flippase GtrA